MQFCPLKPGDRRPKLTPQVQSRGLLALIGSGRWGMLIVATIGRIRREHFIKDKSINEIARDLRIPRNTLRKALRSDETSFSCEHEVHEAGALES